jgi:hypothetical protein
MDDMHKPINFMPNDEDARIMGALFKRLGVRGTALLRVALREKAHALGVLERGEHEPQEQPTGTEG